LNIMSLMGIVMMVGVVVSNSILIVEFTHRLLADGMPLYDAVRFAVRVRLRVLCPAGPVHHRRTDRFGRPHGVRHSRGLFPLVRTQDMKRLACHILLIALAAPVLAEDGTATKLSMEEAKAEALRNHPAYASAQLRALLAKEALKETQAAYYPNATGYVTAVDTGWDNTRILAGGINNPSVYDRVGEGITISQLITDFGRTRNLSSGAKSQVQAAVQGAEASREQIL